MLPALGRASLPNRKTQCRQPGNKVLEAVGAPISESAGFKLVTSRGPHLAQRGKTIAAKNQRT
jgi:hypothetical protein